MSIDYRKWLICALLGFVAPVFSDWRSVMPDHGCSVAEQAQVDAWKARVEDAKAKNGEIRFDTLPITHLPNCVSAQQQDFLVNHMPGAVRLAASISFCISVLAMLLIGGVLWPAAQGIELLVNAAGRYIARRWRQIDD